MFKLVRAEDIIRIPPSRFGEPIEEAALKELRAKYENVRIEGLGFVILVVGAEVDPMGKIVQGDPCTYHRVKLDLLVYIPVVNEVVEGKIVDLSQFGAFVRIGPEDALLHISQMISEPLIYDDRQGAIISSKGKWKLAEDDKIRAKIVTVSSDWSKIGLSMKQEMLGKLEDIKKEIEEIKAPKKGKKGGK